MEKFKDIFYSFINKKIGTQIEQIEQLCLDFDIDASMWFNKDFRQNFGDYSGTDFLNDMLPNFVYYLTRDFEKQILKYVKPSGFNIYKEAYLSIDMDLGYEDGKFVVLNDEKEYEKSFNDIIKNLTLTQRSDLMKNKLFYTIVYQTNLKIYSKNDIRALKIINLNEYSTNIKK